MKAILRNLAFIVLTMLVNYTSATHLMGADIAYERTSPNHYDVILKVYRDCNGIALSNRALIIRSVDTFFVINNKTVISVTDITNDLQCSPKSKCLGTWQYGIEEHVWKFEVILPQTSQCQWKFTWSDCCRNSSISTGQSDADFYIEAEVNRCIENSSTVFNNYPIRFACYREPQLFINQLVDLDSIADSVSIELVEPLVSEAKSAPYLGSFSKYSPLTYLGFPNNNFQMPGGFHLNPKSGELFFEPRKLNETAVIAFKATEWRKDSSGTWQKIGSIRRDVQMIVISCPNASEIAPVITAPTVVEICVGDSLILPIFTSDENIDDSTFLTLLNGPENLIFNTSFGKNQNGILYWRCPMDGVQSGSFSFSLFAHDNSCPFSKGKIHTITVLPRDSSSTTNFIAGGNIPIPTSQDSVVLQGFDVLAGNQSAFWVTLGQGRFDDSSKGRPVYYLGGSDWVKDKIANIRIPIGTNPCRSSEPDTMFITRTVSSIPKANNFEVTFYPNPADKNTQVNILPNESVQRIYILDISGKVHLEINVEQCRVNNFEIKTSDLPSGLYMIYIQGQFNSVTSPLIINHR